MQVDVTTNAPSDWDSYVDQHESATAYHRAAAVAIGANAFGLRTSYLTARDGHSRLVGILPLVEQSSLLFGRFLVSVPFFTYGGILADDGSVVGALAEQAIGVARSRGVDHIEFRHSAVVSDLQLQVRLDKVSMILSLPGNAEALAKQLGSKLRSQIRRADREQLDLVWGGAELLPEFYQVFASGMHQLGTPVYPRRFFDLVLTALHDRIAVLVVRVQGVVQAAAIVVRHGSRLEVPWAAATESAKRMSVNMRMYWALLQYAIETGAVSFDFGRSTVDSGTYRFKAQWGAVPMQLHWHYWLPAGREIPKLNHSNPKYALAGRLWRRMPLWCANVLGPYIVRNLP